MKPNMSGMAEKDLVLTVTGLRKRLEVLERMGKGGKEVVLESGGMCGNDGWQVDRADLLEVGFHAGEDEGEGPVVLAANGEAGRSWDEPLFIMGWEIEIWGPDGIKVDTDGEPYDGNTYEASDDVMRTMLVDDKGKVVRLPRPEKPEWEKKLEEEYEKRDGPERRALEAEIRKREEKIDA